MGQQAPAPPKEVRYDAHSWSAPVAKKSSAHSRSDSPNLLTAKPKSGASLQVPRGKHQMVDATLARQTSTWQRGADVVNIGLLMWHWNGEHRFAHEALPWKRWFLARRRRREHMFVDVALMWR